MPVHEDVAVVVVSHDGARWLPTTLASLQAQTATPGTVVAIDVGSEDDTPSLLAEAFGPEQVLTMPATTPFGEAVAAARERAGDVTWLWVLHDDANPAPDCLERLLEAAGRSGADALGPKIREWPSLRRLLELGVTITGTGRRETGLERGEYDQGQYTEEHDVLAVNSAGMLVRTALLDELDGFDPALGLYGTDIDLGWRAAHAGRRVRVVPDATLFHAEAAHRGVRRTPLARRPHEAERRAALTVLLANTPTRWLPWQVPRWALGTLLRVLGFLLVRQGRQARDELAALLGVYAHPGAVLRARRRRPAPSDADRRRTRTLLAPWWLPYRHGLDFVSDVAGAALRSSRDAAVARGARLTPAGEPGLAEREESALWGWLWGRPVLVLLGLFVLLALAGARGVLGDATGPGLSAPPASASGWWDLVLARWHPLGQGSEVPAPAYLVPLASLATVLGDSPGLVVSGLLLLAVPLAAWGAWRLLRRLSTDVTPAGAPDWVLLWGAACHGLLVATTGALGEARYGVVAVLVLLPWVAHAATGLVSASADRRWRAGWRTGVLLTLAAAFVPGAWVLALLVLPGVLGLAPRAVGAGAARGRFPAGPLAAALGTPVVLLAPWWVPLLLDGAWQGLLLEAGRVPAPDPALAELVTGRLTDAAAPWWISVLPVVVALPALAVPRSRTAVLGCWAVAAGAGVLGALWTLVDLDLAVVQAWPGISVFVVTAYAALVVAAALGVTGWLADRPAAPARRRGPATANVALGAVLAVVPALALGWFVADGTDRLGDARAVDVPAYMAQRAQQGPGYGALVLRGDVATGLTYTVRRDDGTRLGEDEIRALTGSEDTLRRLVSRLVARPEPGYVSRLSDAGVAYVVMPPPVDGRVAATLDAVAGLEQASAGNGRTRAWQLEDEPGTGWQESGRSGVRTALVVAQGVALLVVLVLCGPAREEATDG